VTRLVLIGAGHVHIGLLQRAQRLRSAGLDITLVDTGSFTPGADSSRYLLDFEAASARRRLVRNLCAESRVAHCDDRAIGVDTRHRRIWLASGERLDYDLLSFNVGRDMDTSGLDATANRMQLWRSSAMRDMAQFGQALAGTDSPSRRRPYIAVVGATNEAARIVSALSVLDPGPALKPAINWYLPGSYLLPAGPAGAARRLGRMLSRRGVQIFFSSAIAALDDRHVVSRDGRLFAADHVVVADRAVAPRIIHAAVLPATDAGLYVTQRLQSPADPRVFAVGSCAQRIGGAGLPAQDVVGQLDVLTHNLIATIRRRPLRRYKTSQRSSAIDMHDGSAIAWLGHVWWHNRLAAWLEQRRAARIDQALGLR